MTTHQDFFQLWEERNELESYLPGYSDRFEFGPNYDNFYYDPDYCHFGK